MVVNKRGRTFKKNIIYRNKSIEYVRNCIYLSFCLDVSGNVKEGLFDFPKRAQIAYYKLKDHLGDMFYQNPKLSLKIFDSLVKPILLYCGEFWGCFDTVTGQNNPIATLNTYVNSYLVLRNISQMLHIN